MILLNPGPANTTQTVKRALVCEDICPRETAFGDLMDRVRQQVTKVVHDGDEYLSVIFGGSGTAAVEAAVSSTVSPDGRLLVIDNGSYGARIAKIAAITNLPHDVVSFGVGGYPDVDRIVAELEKTRYTHLAVVHHETTTGMLNPVEAIGAHCRERGVSMIVDAMSSYAGLPIDIATMGADFLISSANKCIQGMAGLSFVVCQKEALDRLREVPPRSLYLGLYQQHQFFEKSRQMQFTPPVQVVYALAQALEEYFTEGPAARHARYRSNWEALDSGVCGLGFIRLLPESMLSRILTAYLEPDHPSYNYDEMHDRLHSKGYTIYPGKGAKRATFRLANMGAVTPSQMRGFVQALSETIEEMGLDPLYREEMGGSALPTRDRSN